MIGVFVRFNGLQIFRRMLSRHCTDTHVPYIPGECAEKRVGVEAMLCLMRASPLPGETCRSAGQTEQGNVCVASFTVSIHLPCFHLREIALHSPCLDHGLSKQTTTIDQWCMQKLILCPLFTFFLFFSQSHVFSASMAKLCWRIEFSQL